MGHVGSDGPWRMQMLSPVLSKQSSWPGGCGQKFSDTGSDTAVIKPRYRLTLGVPAPFTTSGTAEFCLLLASRRTSRVTSDGCVPSMRTMSSKRTSYGDGPFHQ